MLKVEIGMSKVRVVSQNLHLVHGGIPDEVSHYASLQQTYLMLQVH